MPVSPESLFTIPEPTPFDRLLSLRGRTAIMTGGGRGLGKYVVRRLAEAGANVVFCARHQDQLDAVAAEYADLPGTLCPVVADVSREGDRARLVAAAKERFGGIDILVNCAAIYPPGGSLGVDEATWDAMHDIDTKACFFLTQAVAREMIAQGRGGRIVNFLSTAFVNAAPVFSAYAIAKAGVWEMTRVLSKELAPHRITVNAVTPGATLTEEKAAALAGGDVEAALGSMGVQMPDNFEALLAQLQKTGGPEALFRQRIPMGRMGYPEDLANAVLYLVSDMASYVTGQNIVVDGAQADNSVMPAGLDLDGALAAAGGAADAGEGAPDEPAPAAPAVPAVDPSRSDEPDPGLDGTYEATVSTPMGAQRVELVLRTDGTALFGSMLFMGKRLDIQRGVATKAGFSHKVVAKVMLRKAESQVSGVRDGDRVSGSISTQMGSFAFEGARA